MKKVLKILIILVLAACVYSFAPVVGLYLSKEPVPYTNAQAAEKLTGNKSEDFKFIVFGDNHAGLIFCDSAALKLVRSINRESRFRKAPVDFALVAGDVTFKNSEFDYRIFNKIRAQIKLPVMAAVGNHDDRNGNLTLFEKFAGQPEYAFADRNSYFIVVDNSDGNISEESFSRFENELKDSASYKHRFVILHKPPLSPYQQSWYRPGKNPWSGRFMKLCEKYKVDIVFTGHEHMFKEENFGGVKYITSGGGGMLTHFPDPDGGYLHYLVVRVYGDYIDYEVRKIFPPVWEFFTYYMWKNAFYFLQNALS